MMFILYTRTSALIIYITNIQKHRNIVYISFLAKKDKSNIAGRGPDFQDQTKLAAECISQDL